jgi:hypothetical protein
MLNDEEEVIEPPLGINANMAFYNKKPVLVLRRVINDPEIIKKIVRSIYYEKYMKMAPRIKDKGIMINAMLKKGIIKKRADNTYDWTI